MNHITAISTKHIHRTAIAEATWRSENELFEELQNTLALDEAAWVRISEASRGLIQSIRDNDNPPLIDQFLTEYGIATDEGVQLMRLAEALSRTVDATTADQLIADKIAHKNWLTHTGSGQSIAMSLTARALHITGKWINWSNNQMRAPTRFIASTGNNIVRSATRQAIRALSSQFVFAETLETALKRAKIYGRDGYLFSFDMLGEAARTGEDANKYYQAYADALDRVIANSTSDDPRHNHGISIKLSALHPRYEFGHAEQVVPEITALLKPLAIKARQANVQITIDAEEAERLDISMDVLSALIALPELSGWFGLGFVVQAYQRRAMPVLDWLQGKADELGAPLMIRLVKGAYWDAEIKRAQEMGLESYPVYTRKEMTDLSYLTCARKLLEHPESFSPQFATHNAQSIAAIRELAGDDREIEFQRLFGMGQQLHDQILKDPLVTSRIYAPVGTQKDLLSYLIRRLLENGANSSFVNKLTDKNIPISQLIADPVSALATYPTIENTNIPMARGYLPERLTSEGWDLSNPMVRAQFLEGLKEHTAKSYRAAPIIAGAVENGEGHDIINPANLGEVIGQCHNAQKDNASTAIETADQAFEIWSNRSVKSRAEILEKAANLLEERASTFHYLAVKEAGKTWSDAVDEVREAVDFCRYYAARAIDDAFSNRKAIGVVVCISPWNFPLAIFLGQITAALAAGNTVVAKPAEQTPLIAAEAIQLLHDAGVNPAALNFVPGDGQIVGESLISHPKTCGVCFTGSTATAKRIASRLSELDKPLTPLIAETGGINAMIVDSSALLEQTVDDVISSAFQSAGQRCSALRILCVQEDIADAFINLLQGAIAVLHVGDPEKMNTDIGPVIDPAAKAMIEQHVSRLDGMARKIGEAHVPQGSNGHFIPPVAYELSEFSELDREIFGPILHIVRFKSDEKSTMVDQINASGYGLTLGIHSRIDTICDNLIAKANVGNIYINRNQIGAVVGVQPFGGHGLSGTGPKAGGPLYLYRLSQDAGRDELTGKANPRSHKLPSPAGETNHYAVKPRGRILALLSSDDPNGDRALQLAKTTGNEVIVHNTPMDQKAALLDPQLDALLVSSGHPGLADIAKLASERDGAILPIITTDDSIDRFVVEKTVTRNIAAAGGDVSLLNA
ncbi:MAG: bifunctional proline dehydrogenase/L-glutamate gamma-semialdehyde dehydrogenase PutA [Parasphingorhabdus sp.]